MVVMITHIADFPCLQNTFDDLLSKVDYGVARILDKALEERELSVKEAIRLFEAKGFELTALVLVADQLRRQTVGDIVTYVVNRNINFTNICSIGCKFCAFSRSPSDPDAYFLSTGEVVRKAEEAWDNGATEVCIQGGIPANLDGYFYRDLLKSIKETVPNVHIHAFSPMEILYGSKHTGLNLEDYLEMLKEAGLDSVPGTAAEILDDGIRNIIGPRKLKAKSWVEVIKAAHRLGIPTTSTLMYGHVDGPEHWARHLALLREIQKETGGFTEFVPLGFIHHQTELFKTGLSRPGPILTEDLKVHAVSRLMLQGCIDNIQASWVKLGPKLAQLCLQAGANDFGGTLMEENISRAAGADSGQYMSSEEFRRLIREIGRTPAQRTTIYEILELFN